MLFQIYGAFSAYKLLGWLAAFLGLVILNEIGRRTKFGGILIFVAIPLALTVYFIAIYAAAAKGAEWALNNPTYVHMNSWFHYAKLYAADCGCIGFMMLKYKWGIGAKEWFKPFPFIIVAINILIAVGSDFESCMTGWWGIYSSKGRQDMLWPDMTWMFILAYDVWNFEYTYLNLPTHSWYCGLALLLAPTFAAAVWNKGGWIQNRANTLAIWCMFAQVVPAFQDYSKFSVLPSVYGDTYDAVGYMDASIRPITAHPQAQGVIAVASIVTNVVVLAFIIKRSIELKRNPYKNEIWMGTKDYEEAMARAE